MKLFKNILLWIVVAFFAVVALNEMPGISCVFALLAAILVAPIDPWQNFIRKFLNKTIKTIIVIVLAIAMIAFSPSSEVQDTGDSSDQTPTASQTVTVPTTTPTEAATAAPTQAPTAAPTEKPTVAPTEAPTKAPTQAPTEAPTKAPTAAPTEAPTAAPTEAPTEKPTEPPHVHSFSAATCTKPKTCTCGATEGKAAGHTFSKGTCTVCGAADPDYSEITYVLNTESKKFHKPTCSYLPDDNRQDTDLSRDEIIDQGYTPCGRCHP